MSDKQVIREIIALSAEKTLEAQQRDGSLPGTAMPACLMYVLGLCYAEPFEGNRLVGDPRVLDAILRHGDWCCEAGSLPASDEWSHFAWMECMNLVRGELDGARAARWEAGIRRCADHIMRGCVEMETFDGGIPNHGIWSHAFTHRAGQVFDVAEYRQMGAHAMGRILDGQTADGCWREWASAALFHGTPVTGYNLVSAAAVNMYYVHSGDERAAAALDRAWHWFYDFLLPDCSMPPNFDSRQGYSPGPCAPFVARWWDVPEGRWLGRRGAERMLAGLKSAGANWGIGLHSLQFPHIAEEGEEREPEWPEYTRARTEEACVRRRNGWAASLSGMTNYGSSSFGVRMFQQERQDCVAIAHQDKGLLIGSADSLAEEAFSTFVFYQEGAAHYLPQQAYLKSTPPLDTLLLRYGSNMGAVSVDTTDPDHCDVTFSLQGERGLWPGPGHGHPVSAMCARAHLCARLAFGQTISLGDREWVIEQNDETITRLDVGAGERLTIGDWGLTCDLPFEFRWPLRTRDPYNLFGPGEWIGVAEVILWTGAAGDPVPELRPTARFRVNA